MTENVNTHLSLNTFRILFFLLIPPQILSSQSRSYPICPASTRATQREPRDPHRRKSPSLMARMGRNRFAWLVWTRSALFFFPDHSFSFFFFFLSFLHQRKLSLSFVSYWPVIHVLQLVSFVIVRPYLLDVYAYSIDWTDLCWAFVCASAGSTTSCLVNCTFWSYDSNVLLLIWNLFVFVFITFEYFFLFGYSLCTHQCGHGFVRFETWLWFVSNI